MSKQTTLRVAIIALLLLAAAIVLITCSNNAAPTAAPGTAPATAPAAAPAQSDAAPAATAVTATVTTSAAATDTTAATTDATGASDAPSASATAFTIDQSASEARFLINETLIGIPTEVVGVTNLISGTLAIDPADPAQTRVGVITIDARDLRTDRDLRNRAIRRFILESNKDEFRYITFTPTAITGLPAAAAPGDAFTFDITGDLQIKDVVKPATFTVDLKADSATEVSGVAKATILRSDFNLQIPSAPGVADVTEEVRLELTFTAQAD